MIKIIKNYTKIFRGMRLPWLLLFLLVVISAIQANVEVGGHHADGVHHRRYPESDQDG